MRYRAICPSCEYRFGRSWFFRVIPEYRHKCPGCGVRVKSNSKWEWGNSAPPAVLIFAALVLWFFGYLAGWLLGVVAVAVLAVSFALFPYVTKFDLKEDINHTA